ncbi:uncharacterized protein ACNLHF_024284 isoform 2-T2 [Anomaloglossus baeobatrachus]
MPRSLLYEDFCASNASEAYKLEEPESYKKIRQTISTHYTSMTPRQKLKSHHFECFSSWSSAVRLIHITCCIFSGQRGSGRLERHKLAVWQLFYQKEYGHEIARLLRIQGMESDMINQ